MEKHSINAFQRWHLQNIYTQDIIVTFWFMLQSTQWAKKSLGFLPFCSTLLWVSIFVSHDICSNFLLNHMWNKREIIFSSWNKLPIRKLTKRRRWKKNGVILIMSWHVKLIVVKIVHYVSLPIVPNHWIIFLMLTSFWTLVKLEITVLTSSL